jgi:hypothetical protein
MKPIVTTYSIRNVRKGGIGPDHSRDHGRSVRTGWRDGQGLSQEARRQGPRSRGCTEEGHRNRDPENQTP